MMTSSLQIAMESDVKKVLKIEGGYLLTRVRAIYTKYS